MSSYHRTSFRNRTVRKKKFGLNSYMASARIRDCLREIQQKRGELNESLIGSILSDLMKQGPICHFYSTRHYDKKDRSGIDFVVVKNDGSRIGIQAKSSKWNVKKFVEKRTLTEGKNIWDIWCHVILVKSDYLVDDQPLRRELLEIVENNKDGRTH